MLSVQVDHSRLFLEQVLVSGVCRILQSKLLTEALVVPCSAN